MTFGTRCKIAVFGHNNRSTHYQSSDNSVPQPEFREFTVEERATEPAAYAAAAMKELDIESTEEGLPYAVFDFGGGTADFDRKTGANSFL